MQHPLLSDRTMSSAGSTGSVEDDRALKFTGSSSLLPRRRTAPFTSLIEDSTSTSTSLEDGCRRYTNNHEMTSPDTCVPTYLEKKKKVPKKVAQDTVVQYHLGTYNLSIPSHCRMRNRRETCPDGYAVFDRCGNMCKATSGCFTDRELCCWCMTSRSPERELQLLLCDHAAPRSHAMAYLYCFTPFGSHSSHMNSRKSPLVASSIASSRVWRYLS